MERASERVSGVCVCVGVGVSVCVCVFVCVCSEHVSVGVSFFRIGVCESHDNVKYISDCCSSLPRRVYWLTLHAWGLWVTWVTQALALLWPRPPTPTRTRTCWAV